MFDSSRSKGGVPDSRRWKQPVLDCRKWKRPVLSPRGTSTLVSTYKC